ITVNYRVMNTAVFVDPSYITAPFVLSVFAKWSATESALPSLLLYIARIHQIDTDQLRSSWTTSKIVMAIGPYGCHAVRSKMNTVLIAVLISGIFVQFQSAESDYKAIPPFGD